MTFNSLWNYKFFVILTDEGSSEDRLKMIAALYPQTPETYLGGALLFPIGSALVYVFIYPVISLLPIWAFRTYQVWTANLVKKAEKTRVLSRADAAALTRRHEKEKSALEETLATQTGELNELRNALKESEEQLEELSKLSATAAESIKQNEATSDLLLPPSMPTTDFQLGAESPTGDADDELSSTERRLLLKLSEYSSSQPARIVATAMGQNFSLVDADLKSLASKKLATSSTNPMKSGTFWALTPLGREKAVQLLRRS